MKEDVYNDDQQAPDRYRQGKQKIWQYTALLPAFPFLLLAAFCFAKSSEKLHNNCSEPISKTLRVFEMFGSRQMDVCEKSFSYASIRRDFSHTSAWL